MKTNFAFVVVVGILFCVSSCRKTDIPPVDQDTVRIDYIFHYKQDLDSYSVIASVSRSIDSTQDTCQGPPTGFNRIEFNGVELEHDPYLWFSFLGGDYGYPSKDYFLYENLEGLVRINKIPALNPISVPSEISIDPNTDLILTWDGLPIQPGESVRFAIAASDVGWKGKMIDSVGATSVLLSAEELSDFSEAGAVQVTLSRIVEGAAENTSSAGGTMRASYADTKYLDIL